MKNLIAWFKDEEGQGMVEYALIVGLISIVVIIALTVLGNSINGKFGEINDKLDGELPTVAPTT